MSNYIDRAHNLIFNTRVLLETTDLMSQVHHLTVDTIIMSRETAREIMRSDFSGDYFFKGRDKTQPDTLFGMRVAYDDSMSEGEMQVAQSFPKIARSS